MKRTKILIVLLFAFILNSQVFTQPAFARSSGGGDLGEFKTEKFLANTGISLGSSFLGNAISDGIGASFRGGDFFEGVTNTINGVSTTTGGFNSAISTWNDTGTWMASYNSMASLSELGSGMNMFGQQQEWDTSKTLLISSTVQGAVGGFLSPSNTLGLSSEDATKQVEKQAFDDLKEAGFSSKGATKITAGTFEKNLFKQGVKEVNKNAVSQTATKQATDKIVKQASDHIKQGGFEFTSWENTMVAAVPNYTVSNSIKAAGVGALSGLTEGAILASNVDRHDGNEIKPWVQSAAGLAGTFVGATASSMLAEAVPEIKEVKEYKPAPSYDEYVKSGNYTYGPVSEKGYNAAIDKVSFKLPGSGDVRFISETKKILDNTQATNLGQMAKHGTAKVISAVPSYLLSAGVSTLASQHEDRQDAAMVRNAFRGLYPVVGVTYYKFKDPIFEDLGWDEYIGYNGSKGTDQQQLRKGVDVIQGGPTTVTTPIQPQSFEPIRTNLNNL